MSEDPGGRNDPGVGLPCAHASSDGSKRSRTLYHEMMCQAGTGSGGAPESWVSESEPPRRKQADRTRMDAPSVPRGRCFEEKPSKPNMYGLARSRRSRCQQREGVTIENEATRAVQRRAGGASDVTSHTAKPGRRAPRAIRSNITHVTLYGAGAVPPSTRIRARPGQKSQAGSGVMGIRVGDALAEAGESDTDGRA